MIRRIVTGSIVLVVALAAACAASGPDRPHADLFVGEAWTTQDRNAIALAAERWNLLAGYEAATVYEEPHPGAWIVVRGPLDGLLGQVRRDHTIHLVPELHGNDLRDVMTHEIGHALGLGHVEPCPAVMCAIYAGSIDFTPADKAECKAAGVCASP